jgi:hypothetical protein
MTDACLHTASSISILVGCCGRESEVLRRPKMNQ